MATEEINKYIQKRYDRWLDYASYHCSCAGIGDEAIDVLNEVLLDLLQKDDVKLLGMLNKKSGQYTELDYFILRMIKLNATSNTAPYRHKYKPIPVDENVNFADIELEDTEYDDAYERRQDEILEQMNKVRKILKSSFLEPRMRLIFEWRFLHGFKYVDWPGEESEKQLFDIYYKIIDSIKQELSGISLFSLFPEYEAEEIELSIDEIPESIIKKKRKHIENKESEESNSVHYVQYDLFPEEI
jgi:hypothetical protein